MLSRLMLVAVVLLATASQAQETLRPDVPVAIVGGMLLDGHGNEALHHAVVVFEDGRITAVGREGDVDIPDVAVVIDAGGRTVMPGLIDAHIHIDLIGHGSYERLYEFMDGMERIEEFMAIGAKQMLRGGVTTGLDLGAPFQAFDFRERVRRGDVPGPRLLLSGPWVTRIDYDIIPDEYEIIIRSPREAAARTQELIDRGVDVVKTWEGLTAEDYQAIVDTAHNAGVKVHAHLYDPVAIRNALDAGVDVFQHVGSGGNPPYDKALVAEIVDKEIPVVQTIAHRIWVFPATVDFPERLYDPVYRKDMPADIYAEFIASVEDFRSLAYFSDVEQETRNSEIAARQFIDGGAVLGVGTDGGTPLNMHTEAMWREMSALVESGMSPAAVISAATRINAQILDLDDELGTIEPGKLADIIIVNGNPLQTIEALDHVDVVIKDGVLWYDERAASETMLRIGHAL